MMIIIKTTALIILFLSPVYGFFFDSNYYISQKDFIDQFFHRIKLKVIEDTYSKYAILRYDDNCRISANYNICVYQNSNDNILKEEVYFSWKTNSLTLHLTRNDKFLEFANIDKLFWIEIPYPPAIGNYRLYIKYLSGPIYGRVIDVDIKNTSSSKSMFIKTRITHFDASVFCTIDFVTNYQSENIVLRIKTNCGYDYHNNFYIVFPIDSQNPSIIYNNGVRATKNDFNNFINRVLKQLKI